MTDQAGTTQINLNRPYLGWFDHFHGDWQAVIVRLKDGSRAAYRLGDALPYERAVEMCQVLSETTGVPVAGELSKQGFRPLLGGPASEELSNA